VGSARALLLALLALAALAAPAGAAGLPSTQRSLDRDMARAGPASGAYAVDLDTGEVLFAEDPDVLRVPASVEKLYTTATALLRLGPQASLPTTALAAATPDPDGVLVGDLFLRGGGDPTFGPVQASQLAALVRLAGVREITGRVIGDDTAFDALRGPYGLRAEYWVGPLSALTYNRGLTGRRFQARPALTAAQAFERALRRRGIAVWRRARAGVTPPGALVLSQWASPVVATLVAQANQPSDNFIAETLLKVLGAQFGGVGSTAAGARVVRATMARLRLRPRVVDGSGLSRANRTTPRQVVGLLRAMSEGELATPFTASLAVAGRSGTLADRMRRTAARDRCRGKTGTLSDVSALAGYCETRAGARVAFAFLMNRVSPFWARRLQDRMTATLARYAP
jgi:serine-type D-Ala-D-Ala carboxypeptidase/endopeptidase (penicillin-binding protein 4)